MRRMAMAVGSVRSAGRVPVMVGPYKLETRVSIVVTGDVVSTILAAGVRGWGGRKERAGGGGILGE
ncbi:MAG: hypothetical protein CMJ49_00370 [Planctomycetaceae bacterium]|nr:hypothetical protein [Planctomycetaceae bacterium]